jgi:hypothetical protein
MGARPKPPWILNNPIYSPIWTDVYDKDLDALIAVCGRRGACKSGAAQRFGEQFDVSYYSEDNFKPRFDETHITFKASEFVKLFQQHHPTGSVLVWDEIGVENDSRNFYTVKNKLIKYLMETNRYRNYVVLVTTPTLKSMDISTQRLLSGFLEMQGKVGDGNQAKGKFFHVETAAKTGKQYFKYPKYWNEHIFYSGEEFIFPKPNAELRKKYDEKKIEFTKNLWKNIEVELSFMGRMMGIESGSDVEHKTLEQLEKEVLENPIVYMNPRTHRFQEGVLQVKLHVSGEVARRLGQVLNWRLLNGEFAHIIALKDEIRPKTALKDEIRPTVAKKNDKYQLD